MDTHGCARVSRGLLIHHVILQPGPVITGSVQNPVRSRATAYMGNSTFAGRGLRTRKVEEFLLNGLLVHRNRQCRTPAETPSQQGCLGALQPSQSLLPSPGQSVGARSPSLTLQVSPASCCLHSLYAALGGQAACRSFLSLWVSRTFHNDNTRPPTPH